LLRCPLYYDEYFIDIAANRKVIEIVEKILGNYFILHLASTKRDYKPTQSSSPSELVA
jgi:hypothetical protein